MGKNVILPSESCLLKTMTRNYFVTFNKRLFGCSSKIHDHSFVFLDYQNLLSQNGCCNKTIYFRHGLIIEIFYKFVLLGIWIFRMFVGMDIKNKITALDSCCFKWSRDSSKCRSRFFRR